MADKETYRVRVASGQTTPISTRRVRGSAFAYQAASNQSQELTAYNPTIRDVNSEVGQYRDRIVARARDQVRNNSWADGGVDKRVDAVVGSDLWLSAKPNWRILGWTSEQSYSVSRSIEDEFWSWADDPNFYCDVERDLTFGGLMRLGYRHGIVDGDAIAVMYWLKGRGRYNTAIRIMDPDMLSNPSSAANTSRLRDGIGFDDNGAAVSYSFMLSHPSDTAADVMDRNRWVTIPREEEWGRPRVIHWHNKKRAHQKRGVSRLVSAIKRMKMLERYDDTELQAAVMSAVLGLYVTSDADPALTAGALAPVTDDGIDPVEEYRDQVYENSPPTFNGVRIPILPAKDKIQTVRADRPAQNFPAFEGAVLRSIASSLGLTYEQLASDWSQVNYSSARAAMNEAWRGFLAERKIFISRFVKPIYAAWLEEAIVMGRITLPEGSPDFYEYRSAYCAASFVGPARGYVDPLKEAQASKERLANGISTLEDENAEQGRDYRDTIEQRAREKAELKALGLTDPADIAAAAASPH